VLCLKIETRCAQLAERPAIERDSLPCVGWLNVEINTLAALALGARLGHGARYRMPPITRH
jgi:hypothetical protein